MDDAEPAAPHPLDMLEMMDHLGIDASAAAYGEHALGFVSAVSQCKACHAKAQCHAWLDKTPSAQLAPRFCPNADTLFEMSASHPHSET